MPKPKSGHKFRGGRTVDSNSDDESFDNASVYSHQSEAVESLDDGQDDSLNSNEKFEEKLLVALDNATEKSVQTRVQALQSICEVLMHRYVPDFIEERKLTILDIVEKSIRRGKGPEQALAARIAALLLMQLGGGFDFIKPLGQYLLTAALDKSVPCDARAKCCTALGLLNFLGSDDIGDLIQLMGTFETIFSGSYMKGDQSPTSASGDASALHSAALSAWGLLLTLIPPGHFVTNMSQKSAPSIQQLMGMLKSPHLDVRMTAGETIALVFECGRSHDEDFLDEFITDVVDATKLLATDSHKYRAKRDRKTQRATFRDVLRYLEEDESPEINIRFGTESLLIDSWAVHHQYSALCAAMGPGMTIHLRENEFIRDILQLGVKLVQEDIINSKRTKIEKRMLHATAFKTRTLTRSKNRDKRNAVFN